MPFNNAGNLNEDGASITYQLGTTDKDNPSPFKQFNIVRFTKETNLATGRVHWIGLEARNYPKGWSTAGNLQLDKDEHGASYLEKIVEGKKTLGFIRSDCVFNNPN